MRIRICGVSAKTKRRSPETFTIDLHPRRERAATRKLKRQLQQEKRGAMRELRKDSAFISAEHDAEKAAARAELRAAGRAGLAIMQVSPRPCVICMVFRCPLFVKLLQGLSLPLSPLFWKK